MSDKPTLSSKVEAWITRDPVIAIPTLVLIFTFITIIFVGGILFFVNKPYEELQRFEARYIECIERETLPESACAIYAKDESS